MSIKYWLKECKCEGWQDNENDMLCALSIYAGLGRHVKYCPFCGKKLK